MRLPSCYLTSVGQAALAAALAFATGLPSILTLIFGLEAVSSVAGPAFRVLVPHAVPADRLTEANAQLQLARYAGGVSAPLLAGSVAAVLGVRTALLADAVTFLAVAAMALTLRIRRLPEALPAEGNRRGWGTEARRGFATFAKDRVLLIVVCVLAVVVLFATMDNVALVFFAKGPLGVGDAGFGALGTAWAAGMIVSTIFIGRRLSQTALAPSVMIAAMVTGAAVGLAATISMFPLALALFVIAGGGNAVDNVAMPSLIYQRTPEALRGRVFATFEAVISAALIGAMALAGFLIEILGSRGTLLVAGYGTLAASIIGLLLYLKLTRRADVSSRDEPDAGGLQR